MLIAASRADQVVMQNGDTLNGWVVAMSTNILVLQNDNLGAVAIPRAKVASINFGPMPATRSSATAPVTNVIGARLAVVPQTNSPSDLASELRGIRGQTNLIQQVQAQFLGSDNSEAVGKFNELLDGLSTGKIGVNDLRVQAQSSVDELRSLTNGMGPDVMEEANGYLSILNNFLQETAPGSVATNSASP